MELIDTHITFTVDELKEAIEDGTIERLVSNVSILIDDGFAVSLYTRYAGDVNFANIDEFKTYIRTIS